MRREIDDNELLFTKKVSLLRKYCPKAYKYLIFDIKKQSKPTEDGIYEEDLPTSKEFKFVYGQIKLVYQIINRKLVFLDLKPTQFFMDGFNTELNVYKSNFCRDKKDKFKINLMEELKKKEAIKNV